MIDRSEGTTFENDPQDPGGATKFGIDQRSHPKVDIKNLTYDSAAAIYWTEYQKTSQKYPAPMDLIYFNACVNTGCGAAVKFYASSGGDANKFLNAHAQYYKDIVARKPVMIKYLKGWMNRLEDLRKVTGVFGSN
jgi:hypothetical protein